MLLSVTDADRAAFAPLNRDSAAQVASMLSDLSGAERQRLVRAMQTVENLIDAAPEPEVPYILGPHRTGDVGWIAHRQGLLSAQE